jgi:hypothetical protein
MIEQLKAHEIGIVGKVVGRLLKIDDLPSHLAEVRASGSRENSKPLAIVNRLRRYGDSQEKIAEAFRQLLALGPQARRVLDLAYNTPDDALHYGLKAHEADLPDALAKINRALRDADPERRSDLLELCITTALAEGPNDDGVYHGEPSAPPERFDSPTEE